MGTSRDARELAGKMAKAANELSTNAPAVGKLAMVAKGIMVASIGSAIGPDMKMSGVGKSGAKVGVRYDVKGRKNATALLRAVGPLHLVERGTKPHRIEPRTDPGAVTVGRHRDKHGRQKYAAYIVHPGMHGKYPWAKGELKVRRAIPPIAARTLMTEPLKRIF